MISLKKKYRVLFFATIATYLLMVFISNLNQSQSLKTEIKSNINDLRALKEKFNGNSTQILQMEIKSTINYSRAFKEKWLKPNCSNTKSLLIGVISFDNDKIPPPTNLSELHGGSVKVGGYWMPDCESSTKVAILVPYRNRAEQLEVFLSHMHPLLQRQMLDYRIFVVEQIGKESFNKGAIYNIGFNKSLSYGDFKCFIFHDVDLLSENDYNYYGCPASPMHMCPAIDKFNYKLLYRRLVGGIQAITKDHYEKLNGYSNKFWGWGGEDDDLEIRMVKTGLKPIRPAVEIGRYKMNRKHHFRSNKPNQKNAVLLNKKNPKLETNGLNSINTLNFTLTEVIKPLYTLISIDLKR